MSYEWVGWRKRRRKEEEEEEEEEEDLPDARLDEVACFNSAERGIGREDEADHVAV